MSSTPAVKQPEWLHDLDFEHELKSAVDNILQAFPKYTSFTARMFHLLIRPQISYPNPWEGGYCIILTVNFGTLLGM
jgi:hypothetical protein